MKHPVAALVVFAFASLAFSAPAPTDRLHVYAPFVLNGVVLPPGEYKIQVSPALDSVEFLVGSKSVVTAPCRVSLADPSISRDEVHSRPDAEGREEITRLMLAHSRMAVEILSPASVASGAARPAAETH